MIVRINDLNKKRIGRINEEIIFERIDFLL